MAGVAPILWALCARASGSRSAGALARRSASNASMMFRSQRVRTKVYALSLHAKHNHLKRQDGLALCTVLWITSWIHGGQEPQRVGPTWRLFLGIDSRRPVERCVKSACCDDLAKQVWLVQQRVFPSAPATPWVVHNWAEPVTAGGACVRSTRAALVTSGNGRTRDGSRVLEPQPTSSVRTMEAWCGTMLGRLSPDHYRSFASGPEPVLRGDLAAVAWPRYASDFRRAPEGPSRGHSVRERT
jgi:hypothetical protein